MPEDLMRYDVLAQEALRGLVRKVLSEVAQTGLPGDHHFFVTFDTRHAGTRISARLKAQYPEEMTIVLQHQFWDLTVTDSNFDVGLSFQGVPEKLHVPFGAVTSFVDPHVGFAVKFDVMREAATEAEEETEMPVVVQTEPKRASGQTEGGSAEVVSIDAFRKKNG
jgi:hypothetical protein